MHTAALDDDLPRWCDCWQGPQRVDKKRRRAASPPPPAPAQPTAQAHREQEAPCKRRRQQGDIPPKLQAILEAERSPPSLEQVSSFLFVIALKLY